MVSISETTKTSSENIETIITTESLLKKSLKPVPNGRPRFKNGNKSEQKYKTEDDENDEISIMLSDLRAELDARRSDEEKLQKEIADILSNSTTGGTEQSRTFGVAISRLNNSMMVVESDAKQLASSLATISRLADIISGRVSALDVAKTRVVECLQLADDLRDLGTSSEGVDEAIRNEDFELAAQHIHRFLTLDKAVFQFNDAGDKDVGQSVIHSYEVLTNARSRLKEILEKHLDDAIERDDVSAMQRFVKLFPLINEHDSGLIRFSGYLGKHIKKLGEENLKIMNAGGTDDTRIHFLYADTLYLFFEGVAKLLNANQPVISNSYGPDKLLDFFNNIQKSIDEIVVKILEAFSKKRQVKRYAKEAQKLLFDTKNKILERLDPLDIDVLLTELSTMCTHSEIYWKFIKKRLGTISNDEEEYVIVGEVREDLDEEAKKKKAIEHQKRKEMREKKIDQLVNRSAVGTKMQELLGQYLLLEQYYLQESVQKAIDMDTKEEGLMSSIVGDVIYLVKKCVERAISNGSVDCASAALNNGATMLENLFLHHLEAAIKNGYPSSGFAAEALQTAQAYALGGKNITEMSSETQREAFMTAANDARGSADLIAGLKTSLQTKWLSEEHTKTDTGKLEHSLSQLDDVAKRLISLSQQAMDILCVATFKTKLKSSCDHFIELPHCLSEAQLSEFEVVDPFIEQFNAGVDKQLHILESQLLEENFKTLLLIVCGEISRQLERAILKCSFNRLGALQLDREFRQLTHYLSGVAGWSAREKTNRLSQIVSLLNVETVEEATELWEASRSGSLIHCLTSAEVKRFLLLRVDLPSNIIQTMSL